MPCSQQYEGPSLTAFVYTIYNNKYQYIVSATLFFTLSLQRLTMDFSQWTWIFYWSLCLQRQIAEDVYSYISIDINVKGDIDMYFDMTEAILLYLNEV